MSLTALQVKGWLNMGLPMKVETALVVFWNSSKALDKVETIEQFKENHHWYERFKQSRAILIEWLELCYRMEV